MHISDISPHNNRRANHGKYLRTHSWFHKYQRQTPSAKDDNTGTSHPPLREQFRSENDPAQNNRPPVSAPEGCVVIWAWVSLPFLCLAFPSGHSRPRGDPDRHPHEQGCAYTAQTPSTATHFQVQPFQVPHSLKTLNFKKKKKKLLREYL